MRGSFPTNGGIGILITTGKVSKKAKAAAKNLDPARPIIVVDGEELVRSCIDYEIGFVFKPVFSRSALDNIMRNEPPAESEPPSEIERTVTTNDIRAYILVLPRIIRDILPENASTIEIQFGNLPCKTFNLSADRRYVGGITQMYKHFGLRRSDGVFIPKKAVWSKQTDGKFKVEFR